jgi:cobaltochelatase CobN
MHLLAAKPGGFSDEEGIIDLQQSAADIVILSAQDSSLALLSQVIKTLPDDYPSIRLANIIHLNKPAAFDLYADSVLESAQLIIVSLLGGVSYWRYGVEQLQRICQQRHITLLMMSGDDQVDQQLMANSTVDTADCLRCWHYLRQAGVRNTENLLAWLASRFFQRDLRWQQPRALPKEWIYHPQIDQASLADWQAHWQQDQSVAVLLLYRSHIQSGSTQAFDELLQILQQHHLNPLPIVISSLKHPNSMALIDRLCQQANADIILNTTSFAVNNSTDDNKQNSALFAADIPVIQLILAANSQQDWQQHPLGLRSRDLAMNIALPEMDGRIISRAVSFKTALQRDERSQIDIITHQLHPERAQFCARLAYRWTNLRHKPNQKKRIALILANYPTHDGRIGNGVGLDTPASTMNILYAMQQAGYAVEQIPETGNALIQALQQNITNDPRYLSQRACQQSISLAQYNQYFSTLPIENQQVVLQRWGTATQDIKVRNGRIMVSGIRLGETFVGVQPARGYNLDVNATYHDPDLIPPHNYLAFYFWLRHEYQIDAIAHIGKHGNLEWLPGKSVALSKHCWSEIALGAMPHLYPFIVNDPGEGSQAKRRAQAVIIDHLMPAMTRAENYGELAELEQLVDEYYQAMGLDHQREQHLREKVLAALEASKLDQELTADAEDDRLNALDTYLCELKESQIRDGLHCLGESPQGEQRIDTLIALMRLSRGNTPRDKGILHALADDLALDFDPLELTAEQWLGNKPEILQSISTSLWRTHADTRERLEQLAKQLFSQYLVPLAPILSCEQALPETSASKQCLQHFLASAPATCAVLHHLQQVIAPKLDACGNNEIKQFLRALSGKFVPAGPSGAPTRGRLDVLPTGRNFYSVDTRAIPTRTAYELGQKSAEQLITRHLQQHGDYPKTLGLSVWGTSTMRTGGDDIAQAFALMGVEPVWEAFSGRVIDFNIIPAMQLNRPRVDVTLRISGFFRDAFPNVMRLFDSAVQLLADYQDPAGLNPIRDHIQQDIDRLQQQGLDQQQARIQAGFRVFGSKPNSYGAGLQGLIDERCWDNQHDLAAAYVNWGGYAYSQHQQGEHIGENAHAMFEHRLKGLEVVVQNQDNREHDLLDSDDYYQFQGGMSNAIHVLSGTAPQVYHGDHSNPESPKIRTLEEELNRVIRARVLNPKWIKGMQRHGYKGAFEMAATVDYLFAYDATTSLIKDYQYEKITDSYLFETNNKTFLQHNNPQAMKEMAERLLEAMQRGLWENPNDYKEKIEDLLLALDENEERS